MKEKILKIAVEHWNENFGGISALSIAHKISASHQDVLECFSILRDEDKGTLRENVTFCPITIKLDANSCGDAKEDGEVITTMFFPSKQILKQQFGMENKDYGTFLNRLHLGNSPLKFYYFDREVLNKYFNHLERYHISDDVIGGQILTKSEYYLSLSEDKRGENTFALIRYGNRKLVNSSLVNSSLAIAVTLHELSELSSKEQKHWEHHEVDEPIFLDSDHDFEKHIRQNFGAEFVEHEDPLTGIIDKIGSINELFNDVVLFKNTKNDYLKYPVINTKKSYFEAHQELYKLIGTDSLNKVLIMHTLKNNLEKSADDLIDNKTKREKSLNELFGILFENIGTSEQKLIKDAWNKVRNPRVKSAHGITKPTLQENDYIMQFRDDCEMLLKAFEIIEKEILKIPKM